LDDFDFVVSAPALGLQSVSETFGTEGNKVLVKDSETYVLALKSALHLASDGEAVFIFPITSFSKTGAATVYDALPKLGLS